MNNKKKCSLKKHLDLDAINYCQECKIYLCNKCQNYHSELFENHHLYNINKDMSELFIDICQLKNHHIKFEYFCKSHNILCCSFCITKIKSELNGQHSDCDVCLLKDIKIEKKNKLKENIECLENLFITFENSIKELKTLYEKINENKEELKLKIQKIFTKIRNALNDREEELLLDIDNKFSEKFLNEELIKESEKLPNKIKVSLEKGKEIDKEWDDNKLNILIGSCINIENNIKEINKINQNIKNCNLNKNTKFKFNPDENQINEYLEKIRIFGKIYNNNYKFKKCPMNIKEKRKYEISGENEIILTKTGNNSWAGTICENELEKGKEYKWKIKLLNVTNKDIMIGVAPIDFDINSSSYNCGWYLDCNEFYSNPVLYSGPPHNYSQRATNLPKVKNEVIVIMNMNKRTLKFIIDNEDKGESFTDIPVDKPLFPAVLLYNKNDSVEIVDYN